MSKEVNYLAWGVGVVITGALIGTGIFLANKYVLNRQKKYGWSSAVGSPRMETKLDRRY
jgi:hypothetical protein